MNSKSLFASIENKTMYGLALYSFFITVLYYLSFDKAVLIVSALCILFTFRFLPHVSISVFLISQIYLSILTTGAVSILYVLLSLIGLCLYGKRLEFKPSDVMLLFVTTDVVVLSYATGYRSDYSNALQMIICIVVFIVLKNTLDAKSRSCIVWAYICAAMGIVVFILLRAIFGGNLLINGRVSFEGNIKNVTTLCVTPLLFLTSSFLQSDGLFENRKMKKISFVLIIIFACVILLTTARGMIIGVCVAFVIQVFCGRNTRSAFVRVLLLLVILAAFLLCMAGNENFRIIRLFETESFSTGNGRTEVWEYYLARMQEINPFSFIVGVGPGAVARIGNTGLYSHSIYMDVFFAYGAVGLSCLCALCIYILCTVIKSKNVCCISITVAELVILLAHGASNDMSVYILLSLMVNMALDEIKKASTGREAAT